MNEVKIKLSSFQDVGLLSEIALRNGYKVISEPVYEPFWETRIDHFEVTLVEQLKEQK